MATAQGVKMDTPAEVKEACEKFRATFLQLKAEIGKVVVGHSEVVEAVLISLFAGGNVLLEGVPGLGKTLLVRTLAQALTLPFSRIQFTPDLMPSDITGINFYNQKVGDFVFREGPLIAQVVLADEINRATPRTQAALLEAMEERQLTVEGVTTTLPRPFLLGALEAAETVA